MGLGVRGGNDKRLRGPPGAQPSGFAQLARQVSPRSSFRPQTTCGACGNTGHSDPSWVLAALYSPHLWKMPCFLQRRPARLAHPIKYVPGWFHK